MFEKVMRFTMLGTFVLAIVCQSFWGLVWWILGVLIYLGPVKSILIKEK